MKRCLFIVCALIAVGSFVAGTAEQSNPRVLALYTTSGEFDHVQFAEQALRFYGEFAREQRIEFVQSTDWKLLTREDLGSYRAVLWLNDSPHTEAQRLGFRHYMEKGGGWIGFHAAGYNDKDTKWPWFVDFLGGAVFYGNNWPPLPATLDVDANSDPALGGVPASFVSPANEWYLWKPSPREDKRVRVLVSLDASNYPLGLKDVLLSGDLPVVWTNTQYNMVYVNMGHGDKIFDSPTQNLLLRGTFLSVIHGRRGEKQ